MCPGCSTTASYELGADGLALVYRLNSRVDRASDKGVLSHLLAMSALTRRSADTYLLLGVDVWFEGASASVEADLFGVHAGKVVFGEVKQTSTDFTEAQITRDVNLAVRLGADVYVMASPGQIPESASRRAATLCEERGLELMALQDTELRPKAGV